MSQIRKALEEKIVELLFQVNESLNKNVILLKEINEIISPQGVFNNNLDKEIQQLAEFKVILNIPSDNPEEKTAGPEIESNLIVELSSSEN